MIGLKRLVRHLKGWRTLLFSLLVATVGVLQAADWASLIPDGPAKGWTLLGIALAIAWLRVITTTPVGRGGEGRSLHSHGPAGIDPS